MLPAIPCGASWRTPVVPWLQRTRAYDVYAISRKFHRGQFGRLIPPDPFTLPKPNPKRSRRQVLLLQSVLLTPFAVATAYWADAKWNASSLTRSLRTFYTGVIIACDYKINFRPNPPFALSIEAVHARSATRIYHLIRDNGGLYLKIGQAIAMQTAILPVEFQTMFARMFDDAPQNDWPDMAQVIQEDFGVSPEDLFGVAYKPSPGRGLMETTARASASIAQVHWARLPDGAEVAVKIQKKNIRRQIGWDLWAWRTVSAAFGWAFDLPFHTLIPYISERLRLETDFVNEADNSERMRQFVTNNPSLRGRVYIPKVYRHLSSARVLTVEWVEGARLWDKDELTRPWLGGWRRGSPGAGGTTLDPGPYPSPGGGFLKPERQSWKGPAHKGGLGLSLRDVMTTMVDLFSAQMFIWGLVHCDPHPGNVFVRRLPSGRAELVLIDHGLYISISPELRHTYARFWKALISFDNETIREVVDSWGVGSPDLFASVTLLRPYGSGMDGGEGDARGAFDKESLDGYQQSLAHRTHARLTSGIRDVLGDGARWPRELIFIGRNLRIVQGNNQFLGSPVNRIKITGLWASRALSRQTEYRTAGERARSVWRDIVFRMVLMASDLAWWAARIKQVLGMGGGMEEDMEARLRRIAQDFGIELNHGLFEG